MNTRKTIKKSLFLLAVSVAFNGCATTINSGSCRPADDNMRKAILILAKKVERLEKLNGIKGYSQSKQKRTLQAVPSTSNTKQGGGSFSKICTEDVVVYNRDVESRIAERVGVIKAGKNIRVSSCDNSGWCLLEGRKKSVREWDLD